jgi:hypothetical protein
MAWPPGTKQERVPVVPPGTIRTIPCVNGCGPAGCIAVLWQQGKQRVYECPVCHHQEVRG